MTWHLDELKIFKTRSNGCSRTIVHNDMAEKTQENSQSQVSIPTDVTQLVNGQFEDIPQVQKSFYVY